MNKEKEISIFVPFISAKDSCFEAITLGGRDSFLGFDDGKYIAPDVLEISDTKVYRPVQDSRYPYSFEEIPTTVPDVRDLYQRVFRFWSDYFAHSNPTVIKYEALYTIHSYILPNSPGVIQEWLIGRSRTGKTTAGTINYNLGYRAFGGVNPSEAAIYRTLGYTVEYGPMVILAEYEKASDDMRAISRDSDIPGSGVPRVDKEGEGGTFKVHTYFTFGSRFIGANSIPANYNEADMDRMHIINGEHLKPKRPRAELLRKKDVIKGLSDLRNDLLAWKVANFATLNVPTEDPKGEITEGRDWEHYGGIIYIASLVAPELEHEIRTYILDYLNEAAEARKSSVQSLLTRIVTEKAPQDEQVSIAGYQMAFSDIWAALAQECNPVVYKGVQDNTKLITPDGEVVTFTSVGSMLRDQLFGKKVRITRDGHTVTGYKWSKDTLLSLGSFSHGSHGSHGLDTFYEQKGESMKGSTKYPSELSRTAPTAPTAPFMSKIIEDGTCETCGKSGVSLRMIGDSYLCADCAKLQDNKQVEVNAQLSHPSGNGKDYPVYDSNDLNDPKTAVPEGTPLSGDGAQPTPGKPDLESLESLESSKPSEPEQGGINQEQVSVNKSGRSFKCGKCDFETSNKLEFLEHVKRHEASEA